MFGRFTRLEFCVLTAALVVALAMPTLPLIAGTTKPIIAECQCHKTTCSCGETCECAPD